MVVFQINRRSAVTENAIKTTKLSLFFHSLTHSMRELALVFFTTQHILCECVAFYCAVLYFFVILLASRLFIPRRLNRLNITPECEMKVKCTSHDRAPPVIKQGAYASCATRKQLPWHTHQAHVCHNTAFNDCKSILKINKNTRKNSKTKQSVLIKMLS